MKKGHLFILLSSLLFTLSFAEDEDNSDKKTIYKWVQNGLVTYSHIKPVDVKNVTKLDSNGRKLEDYTADFGEIEQIVLRPKKVDKKMEELTMDGESERREKESEISLKEKNCETAQKNLSIIEAGEVYETDSKGDKIRLTEEQLKTKRKNVEKDISYFCDQ